MPLVSSGIDEAGFGPLLGPLGLVAVSAEVEDEQALKAITRRTRVKDSKRIHVSGDLAPIEAIALAAIRWLTATLPATAADCFALLGEGEDQRREAPWMAGAQGLRLPAAAEKIPTWTVPGVIPRALDGALVHPSAFNRGWSNGDNRHELELGFVGRLLARLPPAARRSTLIDRLGGRRYYQPFLAETWPAAMVMIVEEEPEISSYVVHETGGAEHRVAFCVDGESRSPLTAVASCIAKYARELHMLLLNRWWCAAVPDLKPTAGYTLDARRWLGDLGVDRVAAHGEALVRGYGRQAAAGSA